MKFCGIVVRYGSRLRVVCSIQAGHVRRQTGKASTAFVSIRDLPHMDLCSLRHAKILHAMKINDCFRHFEPSMWAAGQVGTLVR